MARWNLATEVSAARVALLRHRSWCGVAFRRWREYTARRVWQRGVLQERAAQAAVRQLRAWRAWATRRRRVRRLLEEAEVQLRERRLRAAWARWREPCR